MIEINCGKAKNGKELVLKKDEADYEIGFKILIGNCEIGSVRCINFANMYYEMQITIYLEDNMRKGYGALAWTNCVNYVFNNTNLKSIKSNPVTDKSVLFHKKLGFDQDIDFIDTIYKEKFFELYPDFIEKNIPKNLLLRDATQDNCVIL
jgi:hypothetical protein